MKKSTILILFILLAIFQNALAQSDYLSDRKLKGRIKSYKESTFHRKYKDENDRVGEFEKISTYEAIFNLSGKITEESRYFSDYNIGSKKQYFFDEFGNNRKQITTENDITQIYEKKFDSSRNLIETKAYTGNGILLFSINHFYNQKGKIKEITTTYSKEAKDFLNLNLKNRYTFNYDSLGNNIVQHIFDGHGKQQGRIFFVYDQSANLVNVSRFNADNKLLNRVTYEYDSQGNRVSEQHGEMAKLFHNYDISGKKKNSAYNKGEYILFEYNKAGFLELEKQYRNGTLENTIESKYDESGHLLQENETNIKFEKSEIRQYQYDEKGNRIEKKWVDSLGNVKEIWSGTYDDCGKRVRETLFRKGEMTRIIITYSYDANGKKISSDIYEQPIHNRGLNDETVRYFYNTQDSIILILIAEGNNVVSRDTIIYNENAQKKQKIGFIGAKRNTFHDYKYNKDKDLIEYCTFNGDGSLQSMETYKYNEEANVVTNFWHDSNAEVFRWTTLKYGSNGELRSKEFYRKSGLEEKESYIYNCKNQLIEELHYNHEGEQMDRIIYLYDNMGNLIQKTGETDQINYEIIYF